MRFDKGIRICVWFRIRVEFLHVDLHVFSWYVRADHLFFFLYIFPRTIYDALLINTKKVRGFSTSREDLSVFGLESVSTPSFILRIKDCVFFDLVYLGEYVKIRYGAKSQRVVVAVSSRPRYKGTGVIQDFFCILLWIKDNGYGYGCPQESVANIDH